MSPSSVVPALQAIDGSLELWPVRVLGISQPNSDCRELPWLAGDQHAFVRVFDHAESLAPGSRLRGAAVPHRQETLLAGQVP